MAQVVEVTAEWDRSRLGPFMHLERPVFRAARKAGGDAIRTMRTAATRAVRERKRIKARRIRDAMSLRFPRGPRGIDDLAWALDVKRQPIPIADYPSSQRKAGVSVGINQGSGRTMIKSAFFATMKSGHRGVFVREGKSRLPIRELFSSTVLDVFNDTGMVPKVMTRGSEVFTSAFNRLLPLELRKDSHATAEKAFGR